MERFYDSVAKHLRFSQISVFVTDGNKTIDLLQMTQPDVSGLLIGLCVRRNHLKLSRECFFKQVVVFVTVHHGRIIKWT